MTSPVLAQFQVQELIDLVSVPEKGMGTGSVSGLL